MVKMNEIRCPGENLDSCTGCSHFHVSRNGNTPNGNTCTYFLNKKEAEDET